MRESQRNVGDTLAAVGEVERGWQLKKGWEQEDPSHDLSCLPLFLQYYSGAGPVES